MTEHARGSGGLDAVFAGWTGIGEPDSPPSLRGPSKGLSLSKVMDKVKWKHGRKLDRVKLTQGDTSAMVRALIPQLKPTTTE